MGCLKPESGKITVFGFKPGSKESGVPGPGVGFMPQEVALHDDLTIEEMLTYFGRLYFLPKHHLSERIESLLSILDLPEKTRLVGHLSGGQKRRVSFAAALIHRPRLLILDEPTVGVDPVLRDKIWRHLIKITKEQGTSVIITTHYIEETRRADVVGFMRKGVLLSEGPPDVLIKKYFPEKPSSSTLEDVFYKLCTVQKRDSLKPVTRDRLKSLRKQSLTARKLSKLLPNDAVMNQLSDCPKERKVPYSYPPETTKFSRTMFQLNALMSKYLIQTSRQPESVVGQFVLPIICLIMFCICIGGTPSHLHVAVVNQEDPPYLSSILLKSINPYILKQINYTSLEDGLEDVRRGKIWGVLLIKQNFSEGIQQRIFFDEEATNDTIESSNVRLYADLTNKVLGITLDTVLTHTFEDFVKDALIELGANPNIGKLPVEVGSTVYGEFTTSDFFGVRDFAAPGFLIVVTFSVAYALTCLSLLLERLDGMFERNYSSGVSTTQILFSILAIRFVFVAIGTTILLTLAVTLFEVPCRGPFLGVLIMLLLQSVAGMGMGLSVFFTCKN
jgi:ABC-type multidrug transport system ATPase subunit